MTLFLQIGMVVHHRRCRIAIRRKESLMELQLQFGYGMMEHCRALMSSWGGGTAILSPRDLDDSQLERLAQSINALPGGRCLLDPQFYLPHADHERLCAHSYWPSEYETGTFFAGPALVNLLERLRTLNLALGCEAFILPGLLASTVNDDWLETQRAVIEEASARQGKLPLIATIALSAEAAKDEDQVSLLLETAEKWKINRYYVVAEHPNGRYLVNEPNWVANVMDLTAGLRLLGAEVVLGYCNHQMLVAAVANASAIASGTWMNVRSFPPEKFKAAYEDEIRQRATWYYCPQALSEYKIPFLDIARRQKVLRLMNPPSALDGGFVSDLFGGVQPSSVPFTEQAAFRHYLHCLRGQCQSVTATSFDAAVAVQEQLLNDAESLLERLAAAGIRGQLRDFAEIVDVNRAALELFKTIRSPMLRRRWASL
jgi:hypothetical protein